MKLLFLRPLFPVSAFRNDVMKKQQLFFQAELAVDKRIVEVGTLMYLWPPGPAG